ncbi:solute carrier family 49 member 4-like [Montipora capricornis]|uniref:solute carrier family 49 member 4-like n=1 Tax=Montipora capricornis TaxID=246305 RepID=UPI0035F14E35
MEDTKTDSERTWLISDEHNPDKTVSEGNSSLRSVQCKVYKRRWYILFVFSLTSIVSNLMWNTWGPIQRPCRVVFGWERWTILLLSSLGATGPLLGAVPSTWLMDSKGLRVSVLVTSSMLLAGKIMQVIPFNNATLRTVVIFFGHLIAMLPSFIANGGPPLVSSIWFPPDERITATAIGTLAANVGCALAFLIGPEMMPKTFESSDHVKLNFTHKKLHLLETKIIHYFYVQIGLSAFLFLCVIIYFPSKPPLPPSIAAMKKRTTETGYKQGFGMLWNNTSYWLLILGYSLSFGIYFGWTSVLDVAVEPFNVDEKTSGWLGTAGSLAGTLSGVLIARSADTVKHWTKHILVALFIGTVMMLLLFSMTCSRILPFSKEILFGSIIIIGLLFNGTFALFFELIMECVYPVGEGTSVGVGLILGNFVILLFDVTFMFPTSDVRWINWVCAGGLGICIPLLLLYKSQYRRLGLDSENDQ